MTDCKECPMVMRIESLEKNQDEMKASLTQINSETKQNDRAIVKLSSDLQIHMLRSEERDKTLKNLIETLSTSLLEYKNNEDQKIESIKEHIDSKVNPIEENVGFIKEKLKPFDSIKIKTAIMWTLWASLGGILIAMVIFVLQDKYQNESSKYTEKEKQQYYEKRVEESKTVKDLKEKLKTLENAQM